MHDSLQQPVAKATATPARPASGQKGVTANPLRAHLYPRIQEGSSPLCTGDSGARGTSRFDFSRVAAPAPVQRSGASEVSGSLPDVSADQIRSAAALGTSGASQALPHQATIQQSFGRHDLSGVRAHTDSAARAGAQGMQAQAFTQGSHVAFATSPSLHLAAHEAAHVVQQRAGAQPGGGIGQRGDRHEQHAEAVAQRVVRGQSSEHLLDAYADSEGGTQETVQRFESEEHQHLGDVATGGRKYDLGDKSIPGDHFELTHGDIIALSGDVFEPHELFDLAGKKGDNGKNVGTRDEVIWGLADPTIWEMRDGKTGPGPYTGTTDPRFGPGGIWEKFTFSDAVKKAVIERYQKLAAKNTIHFAAPQGRDKKGDPVPATESAVGSYRTLHEEAISGAYKLGVAGGSVDLGLAREAAAQHFLTDSFSAGHLRTPIALIRSYWAAKYPLFWYNLRHKIALDTAIEATRGTVVPNYNAYKSILEAVEAMAPSLPAITLGDLLALVFHNLDNAQGVHIRGGGKVMGDAHLDAETENLAVAAIRAGNKDIEEAFNLGAQTKAPMADADLWAKVRPLNGGTKDKYAAELQMPNPDKKEPPQNWKAPNIETLWDKPMLGSKGVTVGATISAAVGTGAMATQLTDLAAKFPVDGPLGVKPRSGYLTGFVGKLQQDPKAGVLDIVSWAPHDMSTGSSSREMVEDLTAKGAAGTKADQAANKEKMSSMSMAQKARVVQGLIDDGKPGLVSNPQGDPKDLEVIFTIFGGFGHTGRLQLYEMVEGHSWTGDFQKTFGFRDELFKAFEKQPAMLARMKKLLNGK